MRCHRRKKDGKEHRYYSVEESRRLQSGRVVQRRVLYLGEIDESQQSAWRKTLEVFDERGQRATTLSRFPEDRPVPSDALDSIQVKLSEMQLRRARPFGNCWLGCELWRQLELDRFWERHLPPGREEVSWPRVLELLVVKRLIDPGSEFRVHRQWFDQSAMDVLLGVDFAVAEKDRLYRCLDRILEHRQELFQHLQRRWKTLFDVGFDVLLYDLTSTYVEGAAGVADGSRDSHRGSAGGNAHQWAGDVLPGGHAARARGQVRKAVARSGVAQGARLGGSEALQPGRRVVCAGPERRPAGEGNRDSAQEAFGARSWRGCCGSCAPCGGVARSGTSYSCGWARRRPKRAGRSGM